MIKTVEDFIKENKESIANRVAGRKESKYSKYYEEIVSLLKKRVKNKLGEYNALTVLDVANYLNAKHNIVFKNIPYDKTLKNGKPHPYAGKFDVSSLSVLVRKLKKGIKESELEFID